MAKIGCFLGLVLGFIVFIVLTGFFIKEAFSAFREIKQVNFAFEPSTFSFPTRKDKMVFLARNYWRLAFSLLVLFGLSFALIKAFAWLLRVI